MAGCRIFGPDIIAVEEDKRRQEVEEHPEQDDVPDQQPEHMDAEVEQQVEEVAEETRGEEPVENADLSVTDLLKMKKQGIKMLEKLKKQCSNTKKVLGEKMKQGSKMKKKKQRSKTKQGRKLKLWRKRIPAMNAAQSLASRSLCNCT